MLGAMGAMCCFAAGAGVGLTARARAGERLRSLMAWCDGLEAMELLLTMERLPMDELLAESAKAIQESGAEGSVRARIQATAARLACTPSLTVAEAYREACGEIRLACEGQEERGALELLFAALGSGTAEMRERAVQGCRKRIGLCCEKAREKAEKSGRLYAELGALGGLMLGIALW